MMNGDESQLMIKVDLDDSCWNGVTNGLTNILYKYLKSVEIMTKVETVRIG